MKRIRPCSGKVMVKPHYAYHEDVDADGHKLFKGSKGGKIVIPEQVAHAKDRTKLLEFGTVLDFCPTAGIDSNGNATRNYEVGDTVCFFMSHVTTSKVDGQVFHIIPSEYIWGKVEEAK